MQTDPGVVPSLDAADRAFMATYLARMENRAHHHRRSCVLLILAGLLLIGSGVKSMNEITEWFGPRPTILERIDNPPSAENVPPLLQVSGESRKGLYLLEKQSELQMLDLMLAGFGLLMLLGGCFGIAKVISHWHDGRRDLILVKLLRLSIAQHSHGT